MWPFGGKGSGGVGRIPTERVMSLSSQGVSETDIIRTLKNEGYTPVEVDTAMRQALRGAVGGPRPAPPRPAPPQQLQPAPPAPQAVPGPPAPHAEPPAPQAGPEPPPLPLQSQVPPSDLSAPDIPPPPEASSLAMPPLPGEPGFESGEPELPEPPTSPGAAGERPIPRLREPMTMGEARDDRRRAIEELAEGIIEEKWSQFKSEIEGIQAQLMDVKDRVSALEQSARGAGSEKGSDLDKIEDKIDTYRQSMNDVSSRMEAMEGAMKNSLQPMMQTLRSLSDAVKSIKEEKE
jgi:prefoldin subunit 5